MSVLGYRSPYRTDDARLDAAVEDVELRAAGVIEDDEPTVYSHDFHMRQFVEQASGEFTPAERAEIRAALGLGPWAP